MHIIPTDAGRHKIFEFISPYCKTMDYLGYTSWRVSNKEELRSLLELSRRKITIKLGRYSTAEKNKHFYVLCVGEKKLKK